MNSDQVEEHGLVNVTSKTPGLVIFKKHLKEDMERMGKNRYYPQIGIPCEDILNITESYNDGTTLVRTKSGGIIAIDDSFEEAISIWDKARRQG